MHAYANPPLATRPQRPLTSAVDDLFLGNMDHRLIYEEVLAYFSRSTVRLTQGGHERERALDEGERFWITRECIVRFLRSSSWDPSKAIARISSTLVWRKENKIADIHDADVEEESISGKAHLFGYSTSAQPVLYVTPSRREGLTTERSFRHILWLLERATELMGPGVEDCVVLFNFTFGAKSKRPSMSHTIKILNAVAHHYPHFVASAHIRHSSVVMRAFVALCLPFVEPETQARIDMTGAVLEKGIIAPASLLRAWAGEVQADYEHAPWWDELVQVTSHRRQAALERFRTLGAGVGLSEWELRRWEDGEAVNDGVFKEAIDVLVEELARVAVLPA